MLNGALHQAQHAADPEVVEVERDDMRELERAVSNVAVGQATILGKVDVLTAKLDGAITNLEQRVSSLEKTRERDDNRGWMERTMWAAIGALGGGGAVATFLQSFRGHP